jgi:hypothetical protein
MITTVFPLALVPRTPFTLEGAIINAYTLSTPDQRAKQSTNGIKILKACITYVCLSNKEMMNLQTKHELMGVECQVRKCDLRW